ncbi:pilus assembly protein [Acinetobacter indicus]|uniref:hypothetical protein n=1 Tax=Acinetobacter indicus TaxID=756892 RepID=UPI001A8E0068|nr:hypothetical protein [Acinetobacter indicus]QSQ97197.1 hypothetical protein J0W33_06430 [Acinetobacter indicus]
MKNLKNHHANVLDVKAQAKEFRHKFKLSTLAGAMTLLIAQSSTSYASDIEIYTKPNSNAGSGVVVMMLDTSGSMSVTAAGASACDLPKGLTDYRTMYRNTENTSGGYTREYCYFNSNSSIEAYYYKKTGSQWYKCPIGTVSVSDSCFVKIDGLPDITGFTNRWQGGSQYFYKTLTRNDKFYDRMSRLKDALYTLATMPVYDEDTGKGIKSDVKIGIGTFPYVSSSGENNLRGYMRIPAAEWGAIGSAQRTKVLNLIKSSSFKGTGGTPTSAAYAEAAAYLLGTTTGGDTYSGINISKAIDPNLVSGTNYVSPLDKSATAAECSGQGIYFLTDGQPQSPSLTNNGTLMGKALRLSSYSDSSSLFGGAYNTGSYRAFWSEIGAFAKSLNDKDVIKHALNVAEDKRKVLTAVVGFGSVFDGDYDDMNRDAKNAYDWGTKGRGYGEGGFIAAKESQQIVESLNEFIGEVGGSISSISTGSSTIPVDALNPESLQAFSYFPQFEPKVADEDDQQLWFGNLKKYYVVNNSVYASESGGPASLVVKKSVLQDLKDIWGDSTSYPSGTATFAKWGALSKLPLGTQQNDDTFTGRKLLTDYDFNEAASGTEKVSQNLQLVRITHQYTTDEKTKTDNPERIKGLMGLLGYNIASASENLEGATANLRQMGSILHSLPVLLTQSGKAVAVKDATSGNVYVDTTDRKDYVLFGTTQGLLHVVDAKTGVEKFSFLPKEMAEKQYELFKSGAGTWDNGKNALYYGVDGEWAAHTVYVSKDDGTLTVDGVVRDVAGGLEGEKENLQGKQWVYGGLRMGGRSYYALDLTGLDDSSSSSPKIKFHIDPASSSVKSLGYDEDGNPVVITKEYAALAKMGQSWSKPKLDYVNWNGERKLVMFVGGGYDAGGDDGDGLYDANGVRTGYAGYEKYNYEQDNEIGAGVYMFDADNGELLWYASKTEASGSVEHTEHDDLQYSVVSEIKTVDRNNDGVVDHLYFGDLAGQAFRVDLHQPQSDGSFEFVPQITRILNLHKTNGTSPRFYYPPVFTAHHSAGGTEGGNIVVASFLSGNKSSPLLATNDSPTTTGTTSSSGLEFDGVYALYEYDIHPTGTYYPASSRADKTIAAAGEGISLDKLMPLSVLVNSKTATTNRGAAISPTSGWGGWYYKFEHKFESTTGAAKTEGAGVIKGLTPLVAMEGNLYVTMFDAAEAGTTSACGAGVKGQSFTQRLCLPTGVCPELANYKYNLGSGIVSLNVGPMSEPTGGRGIVIPDNDPENVKCEGEDCAEPGKRFIPAGGPLKFIPHRWYERYSVKE